MKIPHEQNERTTRSCAVGFVRFARLVGLVVAIATGFSFDVFGARPFGEGVANAQIAHTPRELEHVGVTEHLDEMLPLDTPFRDHTGKPVTLRSFFDGKRPVVLQFAYHTCPVVCGMITTNLNAGLKDVPWTIGQEYDVVTISIDPNESLEKTAAKRTSILSDYTSYTAQGGRFATKEKGGWHFLVGDAPAIAAVTKAAGFEYQYDERQKQWGHPSVVMVVKPDGRMARYLYGLEFPAADLRLGLLEASEGRSISTVEKLILYCYHYDPQGGKYVLVAMRVMQVGAGGIGVILIGLLALVWAREFRRGRNGNDRDRANATGDASGSGEGHSSSNSTRSSNPESGSNLRERVSVHGSLDAAASQGGVT